MATETYPVETAADRPRPHDASIEAVVFDLGNVFLELDTTAPAAAFAQLGSPGFAGLWRLEAQAPFFEAYERGQLDSAAFRAALRAALALPRATDAQLDAAWGSMLVRLDPARLRQAAALRPRRRIFLLSNTNALHWQQIEATLCAQAGVPPLAEQFDGVHLSHRMGTRKPEAACYHAVLAAHGLTPARTLFVDDLPANVAAARAVGMQGAVLAVGTPLSAVLPAQ